MDVQSSQKTVAQRLPHFSALPQGNCLRSIPFLYLYFLGCCVIFFRFLFSGSKCSLLIGRRNIYPELQNLSRPIRYRHLRSLVLGACAQRGLSALARFFSRSSLRAPGPRKHGVSVWNFITYNKDAIKVSSTSTWRHCVFDNTHRESNTPVTWL